MTTGRLARRRMYSHRLWGAPFATPIEALRWLGAAQAQEYPVARWSLAQRATGVGSAEMDRLVAEGAIIRTHILRPTWHFVLPEDIRWMLDLIAPRVHALNAHYYRKLGLDEELFARTNEALGEALEGRNRLTRKELAAVLDRAGIHAENLQLGYVLMRAELDAVICSGGLRGKQQTYSSFDERVPHTEAVDRDEALAELTRRYFTARGPATLRDFLWWSSLTAADGRRGLDLAQPLLENEIVDGRTYWFAPSDYRPKRISGKIDLVQGYDECIVSYSESKDVLLGPLAGRVMSGDRPVFTHAVLLDGMVVGHWRHVPGTALGIEAAFYRPLDRTEKEALDAAVDRYGQFVGAPVALERSSRVR